jgi:hypothetical protein
MMPRHFVPAIELIALLLVPLAGAAHLSGPQSQRKDYLTEIEADKIREAVEPADRIKLFVEFADDRLKKFQYELNRQVPDRRRVEMLNNLMNGYAGCVDDAADQIGIARERQADIRSALKLMKSKTKEFLEVLENLEHGGRDLETYKDTLDDAVDATKDAITDIETAEKDLPAPPVRRRPS